MVCLDCTVFSLSGLPGSCHLESMHHFFFLSPRVEHHWAPDKTFTQFQTAVFVQEAFKHKA